MQKILLIVFSWVFLTAVTCLSFAKSTTHQTSIPYIEAGDGAPIVLIHAFPTDKRLWSPQLDGLQKYFHVIALDLWGFGQSSATDGSAVTMTDYANEVKQLLDQLHIKTAIIGGESMGGYIALAFLKQYPERVMGVILSDTQPIADNEQAKKKREVTALDILTHGPAQFINDFMPKALSPGASLQIQHELKTILEAQVATGMASALRGMGLREDTSPVLENASIPILILTGDLDVVISPQQSQTMHSLAKDSRLVIISNAGHLSNVEQPQLWNQAVVDMFYKKIKK